jgi:hypothetical protein
MRSTSSLLTLQESGQNHPAIAHHRVFLSSVGAAVVLVLASQLLALAAVVVVGATTNAGLVFLKWERLKQSLLVPVVLPARVLIRLALKAATQVLVAWFLDMAVLAAR